MATQAESRPKLFVRNATGLRKEAGAFDILVYNTNNQNIGLGVAFLLLAIGSYPGGNFPLSALMATILVIPIYLVYTRLSADMPRSGGDYVWTSRIFGPTYGPLIGFMVAWTWIVLAWVGGIGLPLALVGPLGIAPWMRELGVATGSAAFSSIGDWAGSPFGTFVIATVVLVVFTALLIRGVRPYMRVQNVTFVLAMVGVVLGVVAGLIAAADSFHSNFNSYVSAAGGIANAYDKVASNAPPAAPFAFDSTFYAMIWTIYMVVFGSASAYIGGEVRRPGMTQRYGMVGSLILTGVAIAVLLAVLDRAIGNSFLAGLSLTPASDLGLAFNPNYNELFVAAMGGGLFWSLVLGFTFIFWTYVWMPINFFTTTRLLLAMSFDGYLPARLADVHPKWGTPHVAIIFMAILGEIGVVAYQAGIISIISLVWAGLVMFGIVGIAAAMYPSRLPDVWAAGGATTLGGIPRIRIAGVLLAIAMAIAAYAFWFDPFSGVGKSSLQIALNLGTPIVGLLVAAALIAFRRTQGVDVRLAATEIPPD